MYLQEFTSNCSELRYNLAHARHFRKAPSRLSQCFPKPQKPKAAAAAIDFRMRLVKRSDNQNDCHQADCNLNAAAHSCSRIADIGVTVPG